MKAYPQADGDNVRPAFGKRPGDGPGGPPSRPVRRPHDLEKQLDEQAARLSTARPELATTEQLIDIMKMLAAEVRALRREVAQMRTLPTQVQAVRDDVDDIKTLLARLRQMAAKRRGGPPPGPSEP